MQGRKHFGSIDEFIKTFPPDVQKILENLRQTIRKAVPHAEETISYQMPAFKLNGDLVYFGAFKKHIGFFPTSSGVAAFKKELSTYATTLGTIQFPLDKPIPYDLVTRIVLFRRKENLDKKEVANLSIASCL